MAMIFNATHGLITLMIIFHPLGAVFYPLLSVRAKVGFAKTDLAVKTKEAFSSPSTMPIRGLFDSLYNRGLIHRDPVSILNGQRVWVEGFMFLRRLRCFRGNEPLVGAMGGIPLGLEACIEEEINHFIRANVSPVIIFPGLSLVPENPGQNARKQNERAVVRMHAWRQYKEGNQLEIVTQWFNQGVVINSDIVAAAIRILQSLSSVEVLRAPYLSWAQLAYFGEPNGVLFGLPDVVLFGFPNLSRIILDIKWEVGLEWMNPQEVMEGLSLSPEQFIDVALLAGCEFIPTFSVISSDQRPFEAAVSLVQQFGSGREVIRGYGNVSEYYNAYIRVRTMIYHHPYLLLRPHLSNSLVHAETAPNDLDSIIGPQLPSPLYYLLSTCMISPDILNYVSSSIVSEVSPVADSVEYRVMLDGLVKQIGATIGIIEKFLAPYFRREVVQIRWYDTSHVHVPIPSATLTVHPTRSSDKLCDDNVWSDMWQVLSLVKQDPPAGHIDAVSTAEQLTELVVRTALYDWGHINSDGLSDIGRVVWRQGRVGSDCVGNSSSILVLVQMAVHGVDIVSAFTPITLPSDSPVPVQSVRPDRLEFAVKRASISSIGSIEIPSVDAPIASVELARGGYTMTAEQVDVAITLISHVCVALPVNLHGRAWREEIDHDVAMFYSLHRRFQSVMRDHLEAIAMALFIKGRLKSMSARQILDGFKALPLSEHHCSAMGIVMKTALSLTVMGGASLKRTLVSRFPGCTSLIDDIRGALMFFQSVARVMVALCDAKLVDSDAMVFIHAYHVSEYALRVMCSDQA